MTAENFVMQSTIGIDDQCGAGRAGCYELVFPVTLQFADSTTAIVNSYDEMKQAMRDWFDANGGGPGNGGGMGNGGHHGGGHHGGSGLGRPIIVMPFQVINEAGEIITIETPEQLAEIRALCNPGGGDMDTTGHGGGHGGPGNGHGGPGSGPCFTPNFPLSIMFPDSSVVLLNSPEEMKAAIIAYHQANPGQHVRPEFVFPITVTLADGTVVTVNSRDELRALKQACRG